ncbi:MAG: S-adenosylmethionine:tRNA ribosyltransferase-isomerase, partial [Lachnospiraceae bacterium]|nr:S-adenosylmethionine:tRNA ribosyltransferase-isomerase [Lachnospiraceae bacterium]
MEKGFLKSDYHYELPEELIAQDPLLKRDNSRLMVLDKDTGRVQHRHFYDIKDYLKSGDCLVLNDTKVIPARLLGVKSDTKAAVEILLLNNRGEDVWEAIVKPGKKLKEGAEVTFGEGLRPGDVGYLPQQTVVQKDSP